MPKLHTFKKYNLKIIINLILMLKILNILLLGKKQEMIDLKKDFKVALKRTMSI